MKNSNDMAISDILNSTLIYLLMEVLTVLYGFFDYKYLHKTESVFLEYFGQLVTFFFVWGLVLIIVTVINGLDKNMKLRYFTANISLTLIGLLVPIIMLITLLSNLHG